MNEAELAQILGEAMRVYSFSLKSGVGVKPFKALLEGRSAIVVVSLNGANLTFDEPQPTIIPEYTVELEVPKPIEEKPIVKPRRAKSTENYYSQRT